MSEGFKLLLSSPNPIFDVISDVIVFCMYKLRVNSSIETLKFSNVPFPKYLKRILMELSSLEFTNWSITQVYSGFKASVVVVSSLNARDLLLPLSCSQSSLFSSSERKV